MEGNNVIHTGGSRMTSNVLRCCATLFVFLLHGRSNVPALANATGIWQWITFWPAWGGVWIFFFLSGFGIGIGFFNNKYPLFSDSKCCRLIGNISPLKLIRFYWGRFLKLAPMYFIFCLIIEFTGKDHFFWNNPSCFFQIITFTYKGNVGIPGTGGHLWYISTAMQLYLFMPFIYLLLRKINGRTALYISFIGVVIIGLLLRVYMRSLNIVWHDNVYTNSLLNLDLVASGMILAKIQTQGNISYRNHFISVISKLISVLFFIVLIIFNCKVYEAGFMGYIDIYKYILPSVYILACALLLIHFNHSIELPADKIVARVLAFFSKSLNKFSEYSYGFYLLHLAVFHYVRYTLFTPEYLSNFSLPMQYFLFFGVSGIITFIFAVGFTKWNAALFPHRKKVIK